MREKKLRDEIERRVALDRELAKFAQQRSVLFADMVGSTAFFARFGDVAGLVQTYKCLDIMAVVVEKHGGVVAKTMGDTLMAYFEEPLSSVRAAAEMLASLGRHNENQIQEETIHVQIGIHYGSVIFKDRDAIGLVVNIAAKIRSVAGADQILISPSLEEKIQGSDIPVLKLEDKIVAFDGERLELFEVLWREMT